MKFALSLDHLAWTRGDAKAAVERTITTARLADEAGIDSLWFNEDPEGWDAFAVIGAIARETSSVRLGPGVTNPFHRHPNLISASVATVDRLSDGRAFLGLGRGQPDWYGRALGIPSYPPLDLLAETFELLDQWWTPPHRASADTPISVNDWERSIVPARKPPIYLAAAGPKALQLAGQRADGVLFNELASVEYLTNAISRVRESALDAGRDPSRIHFYVNPALHVTDEPASVLERKKGFIATVYSLPGMDQLLSSSQFDVASIMKQVRGAMRTEEILSSGGGFPDLRKHGDLAGARKAIPTQFVAELAAIGPIENVRQRVKELVEIGATHIVLDRAGLPDNAESARNLIDQLQ